MLSQNLCTNVNLSVEFSETLLVPISEELNYIYSLENFINDCLLPYLVLALVFVLFGLPFTVLDYFGPSVEFINKYRVQATVDYPVSGELICKCLKNVAWNYTFIGFPCEVIVYCFRIWRGCHGPNPRNWPFALTAYIEQPMCGLLYEILFFYFHYLMHWSKIYKHCHKVHHEWKAPISISTCYAHPVDYFFTVWLVFAVPPLIVGCNTWSIKVWYVIVLGTSMWHHAGFKFPIGPTPEVHDFHHENFTQNYGIFELMDRIHGTLSVNKLHVMAENYKKVD